VIDKILLKKAVSVIALFCGVLLVAACSGQSPSEKAQEKIDKQTDDLLKELEENESDTFVGDPLPTDTLPLD